MIDRYYGILINNNLGVPEFVSHTGIAGIPGLLTEIHRLRDKFYHILNSIIGESLPETLYRMSG